MTKKIAHHDDNTETRPLREFTEKAYLDYSMYVILDRALPHIGDGLKPVQRRIVYAMSELGLKNTAKYKKSARTVGDVLGKFHPHGDSACYEAMVLMAQDFSYRYPLIDGQGNWGSPDDPKSFAAMRYTESRLANYADALLKEVEQGTVEWVPNFDGTLEEPKILPSQLPNVLLNGSTGIAVGMATDIPPHNLQEVVNACVHLIDHPEANVEQLCQYLLGPDYPTEAEIITPLEDLRAMYQNGYGNIRMRAVYTKDQGEIVITALPHQVSGSKILEQIASQMNNKKLPMIADLRDESDHDEPTRLVIVPRSNRVDIEELMNHLFATTDLEKQYRVNLNMIGLDGRPQVKNLKVLLAEWLLFRQEITQKRLQYRLDQVVTRLHLLDGLLIAFLNIDEVIHIIRHEDEPRAVLMKRFSLSEKQADAILDLKLRHLVKLEEMKIKGEQKELSDERNRVEEILGSPRKLKTLVKKELLAAAKQYGDKRRSPIVKRAEAKALSKIIQMPSDAVTVVLSAQGWIRAGKGHELDGTQLSYKAGDSFLMQVQGKSNQLTVFIDSSGRTYSLYAHTLPSARGQGEPLTGRFNPPTGARFIGMTMAEEAEQRHLIINTQGYGFITTFENMTSKNRSGKQLVKVPPEAELLLPLRIEDNAHEFVALLSQAGRLSIISLQEISLMDKGKGDKLIAIESKAFKQHKDALFAFTLLSKTSTLCFEQGKKQVLMEPKSWQSFVVSAGSKGNELPKPYQKTTGLSTLS